MGFDCGFDIYPRLETTALDTQIYKNFLDEIIHTYGEAYDQEGRREDGKILEIPSETCSDGNYIRFMVGECPHLPSNPNHCCYFLRFSSKVSGRLTTPALPYIKKVHRIAQKHFGSRVQFWHEMNETEDEQQWGHYSWKEVHDAKDELKELETEERESRREGAMRDEI